MSLTSVKDTPWLMFNTPEGHGKVLMDCVDGCHQVIFCKLAKNGTTHRKTLDHQHILQLLDQDDIAYCQRIHDNQLDLNAIFLEHHAHFEDKSVVKNIWFSDLGK